MIRFKGDISIYFCFLYLFFSCNNAKIPENNDLVKTVINKKDTSIARAIDKSNDDTILPEET